jgi:FkbM family methyltransferase
MKKLFKAILNPSFALKAVHNRIQKRNHRLQEQRWAIEDSASINNDEKVLFVDLGANLGQGYSWFKNYFNTANISFELFEPNPNCVKKLEQLDDIVAGRIVLHPVGVGKEEGSFEFYGLDNSEGGNYSQGGSIIKEHNSSWYTSSEDKAIKVKVIDFSSYLEKKSKIFNKIIVKMDIEGAEVDLLEALLEKNTINLISVLYVEFHSQYQSMEHSLLTKKREEDIINRITNNTNVKIRIWH